MGILVTANNGMSQLIGERKKEGSKIKTQMQDKVQDQLNHKIELETDTQMMQHDKILQMSKDRSDCEEDIARLNELSKRYGQMDREMASCSQEFEKA